MLLAVLMRQCGVVGFVDGKEETTTHLNVLGDENRVERTPFEGGNFEYKILGDFFVRS
jgi:hypothetical protein